MTQTINKKFENIAFECAGIQNLDSDNNNISTNYNLSGSTIHAMMSKAYEAGQSLEEDKFVWSRNLVLVSIIMIHIAFAVYVIRDHTEITIPEYRGLITLTKYSEPARDMVIHAMKKTDRITNKEYFEILDKENQGRTDFKLKDSGVTLEETKKELMEVLQTGSSYLKQ